LAVIKPRNDLQEERRNAFYVVDFTRPARNVSNPSTIKEKADNISTNTNKGIVRQ